MSFALIKGNCDLVSALNCNKLARLEIQNVLFYWYTVKDYQSPLVS